MNRLRGGQLLSKGAFDSSALGLKSPSSWFDCGVERDGHGIEVFFEGSAWDCYCVALREPLSRN